MTVDETGIVTFDRHTFFTEVFDPQEGDCATFLCPYGGGKTQIALEALAVTARPDYPATIVVMKPRDKTIERFLRVHKWPIVRDWPPARVTLFGKLFRKQPAGYVLWPSESGNPDIDDARHTGIFRKCFRLMYWAAGRKGKRRQPGIIFCDETYSLENELGLKKDLKRIWSKGRSVGCGLWAASQRPVWIDRLALQAQHLFLGYDPDTDMQKRYGEIGGGIDPETVRLIVSKLQRFQFVYINREERSICIIDAN